MEVLDTDPSPSGLRLWVEAQLARRGVRVALGATAAFALGGVLIAFPRDDPSSAAGNDEAPSVETPGLRPPPARGRESPTGPWRVDDDLAVTSGPRGHVVTFSAWNVGAAPEDPTALEVSGTFVDRDDLEYTARCAGVDLDARGGPRFYGLVVPGYKVFVRCRDVTRYDGEVAWIDLDSITVSAS